MGKQWGAYVEAAGVSPCLGQRTWAVGQLLQEVGHFVVHLLPGQALLVGPAHWVPPEVLFQMPGQRVVVGPDGLHVPASQESNGAASCGQSHSMPHPQPATLAHFCPSAFWLEVILSAPIFHRW